MNDGPRWLIVFVAVALFVVAVGVAIRNPYRRGLGLIGMANGAIAASAAALAVSALVPVFDPLTVAGALGLSVLIRYLVDRRVSPAPEVVGKAIKQVHFYPKRPA